MQYFQRTVRIRTSICVVAVFVSTIFCLNCRAFDSLDFSRDIRPILSNKCFACHGPDENTRQADLRLDSRAGLFGKSASGDVPVVSGDLKNSQLLLRIESSDDDDRMPPPDADHQLTDVEKLTLRKWIQQGAVWQQHWAFVTPVRPNPPVFTDDKWSNSPIDRFVLELLEKKNLQPSKPASREALLRRVYLDLTGLPPTLADRNAFLADDSPGAYEKVVNRLLASPQFGEQMAISWLDAARYADSNGYQNDFGRSMWPWRDWVINSINANKPFDEFVIEQIAGDLLPNATLDQKIATGFNRNNRTVTEGGSIDAEWLVENVVDRVETTSATLLGLTMGCARCHDHKFDPVSQVEFYQFFAFFNNVNEKGVYQEQRGNSAPLIAAPTKEQRTMSAKLRAETADLKKRLAALEASLSEKRKNWISSFGQQNVQRSPKHQPSKKFLPIDGPENVHGFELDDKERFTESILGRAVKFEKKQNHKIDLGDAFKFSSEKSFSVSAWVKPDKQGAIISRMDHKNAYRGFDIVIMADGRVNVHLIHRWTDDAIKITTHRKLNFGQWNHVAVTWDGSKVASGLNVFFDTAPTTFEANNDSLKGDTTTDKPVLLGLRGDTPPLSGWLSDVRLFDRQLDLDAIRSVFGLATIELAKTQVANWNEAQTELANLIFRARFSNQFSKILQPLADAEVKRSELERQFPTTMIMEERPERRKTYVLNRGMYDQPDNSKEILPGVPSFLPGLKPEHFSANNSFESSDENVRPASRLALARWLVDRDNPLTARVTVNRIWQHHFGAGLVKTPEDFGIQSSLPSHPKLLDWLAVEFMESGWDVKRLHKSIVMSQSYRQSSVGSAESYKSDPGNRWLSRGPRFRLSSEEIRDNALAISGLLNPKMGGPPIKPYQPAGLWKELAGGASQGAYKRDTNDGIYRRSIYINRKRTVPPPSMTTFDGGSRETCQVARQRTNTPLQALALLNDETYLEAARHLAMRAIRSAADDRSRLKNAFVRATVREPTANELAVLERGLLKYKQRFAANEVAAKQLLSVGQSPVDDSFDPIELASFASVASLLLNLDETITRE